MNMTSKNPFKKEIQALLKGKNESSKTDLMKTCSVKGVSKTKIKAPVEKPITSRPNLLKDAKTRTNELKIKKVNPDRIKSKVENQFRNSIYNQKLKSFYEFNDNIKQNLLT